MLRARKRQGFGWTRWSRDWLYETLGLFNGYRAVRLAPKVVIASYISEVVLALEPWSARLKTVLAKDI
jgi:hypothetical protein